MISFRTRAESIASTLIIVAILMLVAALGWFLLPLPKVVAQKPTDNKGIQDAITKSEQSRKDAEAKIEPLVWDSTPEQVNPLVQTKINELVKKDGVKLVGFQPQKSIEGQGLVQLPFGLTLDGSFPNTMKFVKDIENNQIKLAVTTVQIASADQASDHVTGTVNLAAFIRATKAPAASGTQNAKKS